MGATKSRLPRKKKNIKKRPPLKGKTLYPSAKGVIRSGDTEDKMLHRLLAEGDAAALGQNIRFKEKKLKRSIKRGKGRYD
jgi:hypothetical protein